jgi:protein regulator of cytokinesis 1
MSLDLKKELYDVHPSYAECELGRSKPVSISNSTLERLDGKIHALKRETKQRLRKVCISIQGSLFVETGISIYLPLK